MDEEVWNVKKSWDCMSNQQFQSKNSCFTKFKSANDSLIAYSKKSQMSIENQGHEDLLKKLSGSDTVKIQEEILGSLKSSQNKKRSEILGKSDEGQDKNKLGEMSLILQDQNQVLFKFDEVNHECDCIKYKKKDYCPTYCTCYNLPQKCSPKRCCRQCYEEKEKRFSKILQKLQQQNNYAKSSKRQAGLNSRKTPDVDVGIYIDGGKKLPKKFREERCECRNSKCENKYCVCFTAGNKCSIKCLCENCRNSDFIEGKFSSDSGRSQTLRPYLEGEGSNESFSEKMQFQPFQY